MSGRQLSDLYDADRRRTDPVVTELAARVPIPHPLYEVPYGDGVLPDTTAGRVHSRLGRQLAAIRAAR